MSSTLRIIRMLPAVALALGGIACEETKEEAAPPKATSKPKPTASAPVVPSATATATAKLKKPSHPCPKGSEGEGTFSKPCKADGTSRLLQVDWNRKEPGDKGPTFRVINNSDLEVLYGRVVVYFYDKAGKQLDVEVGEKTLPNVTCGGNIFAGAVKPGEKIFVNFSCVGKKHVPEGFKTIEAEAQMIGFTDDSGKKSDTYWRNDDLVPDKRPRGGIKAKKKSKKK